VTEFDIHRTGCDTTVHSHLYYSLLDTVSRILTPAAKALGHRNIVILDTVSRILTPAVNALGRRIIDFASTPVEPERERERERERGRKTCVRVIDFASTPVEPVFRV
jgi:hypothetical protein